MARRNIILTTLSIRRTRYPSGANLLVSRPWNDVIIITSWEWIMTLSGGPDCVHDYHVVTSNGWWRQKIFKIKYFDGLNFVVVMNDPDNSSKITFVWPLFYHYDIFLLNFDLTHYIWPEIQRKMLNQVLRSDPQIGLFEPKHGLLHSSYFVELNQDVHAPLCSTLTLLFGFWQLK